MDASPEAAAALLERAVGYALCAVRPVTPAALSRATPCARWDLRALLRHAADSLEALREGAERGRIALLPGHGPPRDADRAGRVPGDGAARDPAAVFRARAAAVLADARAPGACGRAGGAVTVAGLPLTAAALALAGAVETAVHGWDIAQATGLPRPVPAALATSLLGVARRLVPGPYARGRLFAPPVGVPAQADPSDRLVAFLGRDPRLRP